MGIGAENVGENGMGMGMDTSMSMGVNKPKSMEFHRQQLKEKLDDEYASLSPPPPAGASYIHIYFSHVNNM